MTTMQQWEVEEALEKHSQLFDIVEQVASKHTDLLLDMSKSCFDLLATMQQQKVIISAQGNLLNQCMERIMTLEKVASVQNDAFNGLIDRIETLEGRGILGNFNQRLELLEQHIDEMEKLLISTSDKVERLEDNTAKYYSIDDLRLSKMLEATIRRVDNIEIVINMPDPVLERVDALENWLYTHDYQYFQEEEKHEKV